MADENKEVVIVKEPEQEEKNDSSNMEMKIESPRTKKRKRDCMPIGQIQHKPGEVVNPQISDLDGIQYIGLFWSEKLMIRILDLSHQYFLSYEVRSF